MQEEHETELDDHFWNICQVPRAIFCRQHFLLTLF